MVVTELRWVILSRNSPPRQRRLVTSGYTPFTTKHTQCKRVLTITATPSPTAPPRTTCEPHLSPWASWESVCRGKDETKAWAGMQQNFIASKEGNEVDASGGLSARSAKGRKQSAPDGCGEILPAVRLPAPQREQGQQVFPRLPLWSSQPRGAQENKDTGGKGESGRGERPAWAVLSESAGWPRPFARGAGVAQPL